MLHLTSQTKVYIATEAVDFRKQIDGLVSLCINNLHQTPRDGSLYVFINRAKTMIKILSYEHNGYWLSMKRLSRGRYPIWPHAPEALTHVMAHELRQILRTNTCVSTANCVSSTGHIKESQYVIDDKNNQN